MTPAGASTGLTSRINRMTTHMYATRVLSYRVYLGDAKKRSNDIGESSMHSVFIIISEEGYGYGVYRGTVHPED